MHDPTSRAIHPRRHGSSGSYAAVAAVLFLVALVTMVAPRIGHSAQSDNLEVSSVPAESMTKISGNAAHDIAIETVAPGREGLELTARLTEDGGIIERPIAWTVSSLAGEKLYAEELSIANLNVPPGSYVIDIKYGAVHLAQSVNVAGGTRLIVSFVLDAGGIRILPRLQGMALAATASRNLVYALSGTHKGELIATSRRPGEILRVPAGEYRIVSRFEAGNAEAVSDVQVRPGIMSAVEIDHAAGLARLAFVGAPGIHVEWRVADDHGQFLPPLEGLSADLVLKPGTYTASASTGAEVLSAKFIIAPGEARDIILGN